MLKLTLTKINTFCRSIVQSQFMFTNVVKVSVMYVNEIGISPERPIHFECI